MSIKDLFQRPETKTIGGVDFQVSKIALENFDDAVQIGVWASAFDAGGFDAQKLLALKAGTPERAALCRVLASCLTLAPGGMAEAVAPPALTPADIEAMPVMMVAEAVAVVLEVNLDFFIQTLPTLTATAAKVISTGSRLRSSSSAPGTTSSASAATASASSGAS